MTWRKSAYSGSESSCVEVRGDLSALRDSKNPEGPILHTAGIRQLLRFVAGRDSVSAPQDQ